MFEELKDLETPTVKWAAMPAKAQTILDAAAS